MNDSITFAIGNTPLVRLQKITPPNCADIYVKLEYFNPTGSYKDRMALAIIEQAEQRGALKPGMTVVECTGGSTGTSLAFLCAVKGYKFKVVSSDAFAKEKLKTMRLFGADLELLPSEGGKITPDLIPRMIARAEQIAEQPNTYLTKQFENTDAVEGYKVLAGELLTQMAGKRIDAFCGAVGTAGMMAGVSQTLKAADANTHVVILEPASAPLLSQGTKGTHKVEGIGVGLIPPLLAKAVYNEIRVVDEADARQMAKRLATEEGIFGGTSTGMNIAATLKLGMELGPGHTVVTVACDSGMKYLSGDLFD
jgi:cysteine synthase A